MIELVNNNKMINREVILKEFKNVLEGRKIKYKIISPFQLIQSLSEEELAEKLPVIETLRGDEIVLKSPNNYIFVLCFDIRFLDKLLHEDIDEFVNYINSALDIHES